MVHDWQFKIQFQWFSTVLYGACGRAYYPVRTRLPRKSIFVLLPQFCVEVCLIETHNVLAWLIFYVLSYHKSFARFVSIKTVLKANLQSFVITPCMYSMAITQWLWVSIQQLKGCCVKLDWFYVQNRAFWYR